MCCLTLPQTLALFASNARPLCLKRYHPLLQTLSSAPANVIIRPRKRYHPPLQTLSSAPANVIIRPCKRYHPLLQTLSSAPANVIIRPRKRYHPPLQTLSSAPANVIIRPCKRYHPLLQTLSSAPANVCLRFWLFLPRDDERYGLPIAPWISSLIGLFVWGQRKDVCNISFAGGGECRSLTCILCGEQNLHKWQSSRNFVPYYIYKKKYIWIHSNSFAV